MHFFEFQLLGGADGGGYVEWSPSFFSILNGNEWPRFERSCWEDVFFLKKMQSGVYAGEILIIYIYISPFLKAIFIFTLLSQKLHGSVNLNVYLQI